MNSAIEKSSCALILIFYCILNDNQSHYARSDVATNRKRMWTLILSYATCMNLKIGFPLFLEHFRNAFDWY